jgi:hypothetical protein
VLGARARQEAADLCLSFGIHIGPNHRRAKTVRLGHDRRVWNDNLFPLEPHAIAAILRVPVDVAGAEAIREGAAQAFSAGELIEPRV